MNAILRCLTSRGLAPPLEDGEAQAVTGEVSRALDLAIYPRSVAVKDGVIYCLGREAGGGRRLCLVSLPTARPNVLAEVEGERRWVVAGGREALAAVAPADHRSAVLLRRELPFCAPRPAGLRCSIGLGDRLGLATPGHVRAVRGRGIFPVFAQQSIREMERTGRSPEQVMDEALFGLFQEGWREGFGADADHLKTEADLAACVEAGFTAFTIDPGDYVNDGADSLPLDGLEAEFEALPWDDLEETPGECLKRHAGITVDLGPAGKFEFGETALLRSAVKYGAAVAHTVKLYRLLADLMTGRDFELEMSVDETASPTSAAEHYYVAAELKRLGVKVTSLAPRFVGEFEKGIDYKGDLAEFEASFAGHAAIARLMGPYKLSIHSGSDKFSIYPVARRLAGDLVHLKTAGTSYLEALRVVAEVDAPLFREIFAFALERYDADRATYHVSADPALLPRPEEADTGELARILDDVNGRQVLHVTYGSVLQAEDEAGRPRFRGRLMEVLASHEKRYAEVLEAHLGRHAAPFAG